jgi:hypothetical protein
MAPVTIAPVTTYTAICQREGDWWVITVPELESGSVTQARSLDEVPATVADLVALMTGADPTTVEVEVQTQAASAVKWAGVLKIIVAGAVGAGIAAVILSASGEHLSMNVGTWVAIAAAFIAVVAVYFNARSSQAAIRAAGAAEEQTKIQRQLRIDAAQPYVWVDVRPDDVTGRLLNLVIGNSGPTIATNVRIRVDPPLPAIDELKERATAAQSRLAEGISSLPPGRILSWPLGQGFNLLVGSDSQAHTFTINADGPFGPVPPLTYIIDLSDLRGTLDRPSALYQLTEAVRDLASKLGKST